MFLVERQRSRQSSPMMKKTTTLPVSIEPVTDTATVVRFPSVHDGTMLVGHLYVPTQNSELCPAVICCLGLGLTQSSQVPLPVLRDQLLRHQMAVLTFDYRTFGESEGMPRHQVKPKWQLEDIQAAIAFLQQNDRIRSDRIALWGTSLGGGHVLATAAAVAVAASTRSIHTNQQGVVELRAVVSLVPHTRSALETALGTVVQSPWTGSVGLVRVIGTVLWGLLRSLVLGSTTYLPLHGPPGSAAMMQTPGDDEGYRSIAPAISPSWTNAATIGSVPALLVYRPISTVRSIRTPTLLLVASHDTLCPTAGARRAADLIPGATLVEIPRTGHFDVYQGEVWNRVLTSSVTFLQQHLLYVTHTYTCKQTHAHTHALTHTLSF